MLLNLSFRNLLLQLLFLIVLQTSGQSVPTQQISPTDSGIIEITSIQLIGNKLTRDHILLRELTFKRGDTLRAENLDKLVRRSEENLINTSLFNSAKITWLRNINDVQVFIIVTERWYIFPLPIFEIAERNFNVWWETKDFSRIVYGGVVNWNNFRGRNETVAATVRLGYTQRISLYYNVPFINKNQRTGLTFGMSYARNHQVAYATAENKILYYKDEDLFARREFGTSLQYFYRHDLYETHALEGGYRETQVLDTVASINPDYLAGGKAADHYFSFRYLYKSDHRDRKIYPLRGNYFELEFVKNGIRFLGDEVNIMYVGSRIHQFFKLNNNLHFGSGVHLKYSGNSFQPYYNTRGLGHGRDVLRGYEFYVIDGQRYVLFKNNLKLTLLNTRELYAGFVPFHKFNTIPIAFYMNLYGDAGYVRDKQFSKNNPLTNQWLYSGGIGVDMVTYYDMVFRLEYSVNKLRESGIFLHFTAPI